MTKRLPGYLSDAAIVTVIFLAALIHYAQFYKDNESKFSFYQNYLYSAVDIYCLGDPDAREGNSPATQELNYRINLAVISCDDIKKSPKVQASYFNGWHDTHPIFSTLVGYSWRLFGLKWTALAPLVGSIAALTVLSFYVILRCFGVPWYLALPILPFIVPFPVIDLNFTWLRDFSKVPFILLSFATLGILFGPKISYRRRLVVLALSTGIAVIGMGFRQDCIVIVPTILAAAALTSSPGTKRGATRLIGDLALIVASFVTFTLVLNLLKTTQVAQLQGYPHFLVQGFADNFWAAANIKFAGLSFMAEYSDTLAWAMVDANTVDKVGYFAAFDPNYTSSGFDLIFKYAGLSAADMVTRVFQGLAAVSYVYWVIQKIGIWILLLLALIASGKWRLGYFLAFAILSLVAAGSLQFGQRHILHLIMLDRVLLVIIAYVLLGTIWSFATRRTTLNLRLAILSGVGALVMPAVLVVGADHLQHDKLLKLKNDLEKIPWVSSQEAYAQRYPEKTEAILRITIDPRKCAEVPMEVELTVEGQKKVRPLSPSDGTLRPLYFALIEPKIAPTMATVRPEQCVIERAWGPLGDGSIPPLQFFDPRVELESQTLGRHLSNLLSSFL